MQALAKLGDDFVLIQNPGYVHPDYDVCPLAPRKRVLDRGVRAVLLDMDGTTTTTEDLCLHSLETTVRHATGWPPDRWRGLDPVKDFPHIIGTSVTQNMEYLVKAYGGHFQPSRLLGAFIEAIAWTLGKSASEARKLETQNQIAAMGMQALLNDEHFAVLLGTTSSDCPEAVSAFRSVLERYAARFARASQNDKVRASMEVYYGRLHLLFMMIGQGKADAVARAVLGSDAAHPIRPLPGVGALHALAKGWLGPDAAALADILEASLPDHMQATAAERKRLKNLGMWFERHPAAVALVTSSSRFEADVVLVEVFRGLREEVEHWPLPPWRKQQIRQGFATPSGFYDTMVTATDCHEIRLKPHRDLYTVALHQLGLSHEEFDQVIGFEDTEAGIIALRAAGVALSCAVPFAGTQGHDFSAASHAAVYGIPEVLLKQGLYLHLPE